MKLEKFLKELSYNFKKNLSEEQFEKINAIIEKNEIKENAIFSFDNITIETEDINFLDSIRLKLNDFFSNEKIEYESVFSINVVVDMENESALDYLSKFFVPSTEKLEFTCFVTKFVCNDHNNYFLISISVASTSSILIDVSDIVEKEDYNLNNVYNLMKDMLNQVIKS